MAFPLKLENNTKVPDGVHRKEEEENFSYALQLVSSSVLSMSLHTAIELGIFEILAKAKEGARLSPAEIVEQMATNNPEAPVMIDRILRLLASHSILSCSVVGDGNNDSKCQRFYGLCPVSKYFASNEDGVSVGPMMALVHDKIFLDSWSQLKHAILEGGIPFNRVHGKHAFEYLGLDPRFNQVFVKAMCDTSTLLSNILVNRYKGFEHFQKLVDVGGAVGMTLHQIILKFPHIKGINFDLPHVIQHAPTYPGVKHMGGNMFDEVPSGDAILLKSVLHNWSEEHCLKILKNCYNAIPSNGKVIVVDTIIPVKPETSSAVKHCCQVDVFMMIQHIGGKERSQKEFLDLATGAGFSGIKFEYLMCNQWIMEFFK